MSLRRGSGRRAAVFAALGDETRLALIGKLSGGERCSIVQLTEGTKLTRQAVTKHLRVLERVRLVHRRRDGRESVFEFNGQPVNEMRDYLEVVSRRWDAALGRLKRFVED